MLDNTRKRQDALERNKHMDTQNIRNAFLNAPEKSADLEIPEWLAPHLEPGTELAIKDIPGNIIGALQKQAAKDPNQNDVTMGAALICRCLMNKADEKLIFDPADRDMIASWGATKLKPLNDQIGAFFGFVANPVAVAKKN